jgi:WD40 repeat protein
VTVWDVETRQPHGPEIELDHDARSLAFSPDGRLLVTTEGEYGNSAPMDTATSVHVWDVASRTPVDLPLEGHAVSVNAVAFSPDGEVFATGDNDGTVVLHDSRTGATVGPSLSAGTAVRTVAFGRNGDVVGVGAQGGDSLIYDADTGAQLASLPGEGALSSVVFSPDGQQIAVTRGGVRLFDATTFAPTSELIDPHVGNMGATFSPDGGMVAIAGGAGIVGLWDVEGHPLIERAIPGSGPFGAVLSPDGTVVAVPGFDRVMLYDTTSLAPVGSFPVPPGPPVHGIPYPGLVSFSHDGDVVAVSGRDRTVQRYDASTLAPVGDAVVVDAPPSMLAFSPDDRLLAVGSSEDRVTLVDAERGTAGASQRLGRAGFVYVAFSSDGRRLVATNAIGGASELDLTSVEPTPERIPGTEADVTVVAFSPDGRVAATGGPHGTVQFRDPDTFEPLGAPVTVGSGLIYRVAFSPDGSLVAAGDLALNDSAQVRLIDVATRQPVGDPFRGFPGPLSFGPDSTVLALPGTGGTSLWTIDPTVWRERACEIAGRNLTPAERHVYLPNDPDAPPTCSRYPG